MKGRAVIRDDRGATLVMVLISTVLVGLVASLVLSITMGNVEMQATEKEGTKTFYSAEAVIDSFCASVKKKADESLGHAYSMMLQKYAIIAPAQKQETFKRDMAKHLYESLKKEICSDNSNYDSQVFLSYISDYDYEGTANPSPIKEEDLICDESEGVVTIKNFNVKYTEGDYKSDITTDIVIRLSYPDALDGVIRTDAYADYSLIADGANETSPVGISFLGNADIEGNVYSRKNLLLEKGTSVNCNSPVFIVGNRINITEKSKLKLYSTIGLNDLWTKNILTVPVNASEASENELSIDNVNCYIGDDITINGNKDKVSITGGSYYGYASGESREFDGSIYNVPGDGETAIDYPGNSSAININGSGVDFKMDVDSLWLAGQSYVSVPKGYGASTDPDINETKVTALQGEAISYKGGQAAYLLPGDCIPEVGHNPMTEKEFDLATGAICQYERYDADGNLLEYPRVLSRVRTKNITIDTNRSESLLNMNLDEYLDLSNPCSPGSAWNEANPDSRYRTAYVQYRGQVLVYLYMNFVSAQKAKEFYQEYYRTNSELVDSRMKTFGDGTITVNAEEMKIIGNWIEKGSAGGSSSLKRIDGVRNTNADIRQLDLKLNRVFSYVLNTLNEDIPYNGTNQQLTKIIFDFPKFEEILNLSPSTLSTKIMTSLGLGIEPTVVLERGNVLAPGGDIFMAVKGDVRMSGKNAAGLMLVDGNVNISGTSSFRGLIIATGNITVNAGSSFTAEADSEMVKQLIDSDDTLKEFFRRDEPSDLSSEAGIGNSTVNIEYDNWRRN